MPVDFQAGFKLAHKRTLEHGPSGYACTFTPIDGAAARVVTMTVEMEESLDGDSSQDDTDRARISCFRDEADADIGGVSLFMQGDRVLLPSTLDPAQVDFVFQGEVKEIFQHRIVVIVERNRQNVSGRRS